MPIGSTREWYGLTLTMTEDGWRAEVKHSMHRRCKGWDYCKPWTYLVTMDTQHHDIAPMPLIDGYRLPEGLARLYAKGGHPHLFGELAEELDADGNAVIMLNAMGRAVEREIDGIASYHPEVQVLRRVVMPNHIHMIIKVVRRLPEKKPLGEIIKLFKGGVNRAFKEVALGLPGTTRMRVAQPLSSQSPTERTKRTTTNANISTNASKASSNTSNSNNASSSNASSNSNAKTGHGPKNPKNGLVFEAGFHDRILFRKGQLQTMIKYIDDNPTRLWEVVHNRQYFEKMAGWRITMPLLPDGGTKNVGRWWDYYPGGSRALLAEGGAKGLLDTVATDGTCMTMTFNAIGNRQLLKVPERMQIQCSRSMPGAEIDALIEDVLEACLHGVVIVSPCISEGEKRVARAVMEAGYPLIVIFPNGIPPQTPEYKPYGVYFDACARGQLLILSPWEFYAGRRKLARWQCLLLNDIAAQLSV